MNSYDQLAVIVPLAPGEGAWRILLPQLAPVAAAGGEILIAATEAAPGNLVEFLTSAGVDPARVRWLKSRPGRAFQMNSAALLTGRPFLWFLHADSRLDGTTLPGVRKALAGPGGCLWYFRLRFLADGPRLARLNARGAWLRSRYCGMPFGDQGFIIERRLFFQVGAYDMSGRRGEDHLLAWAVREHGRALRWTGGNLHTSSRRYRDKGWFRTTLVFAVLTLKQAMPCYLRIILRGFRR